MLKFCFFIKIKFLIYNLQKLLWKARYYINESTIDDANKYLSLVEQIGVILFSNLEKDKKAKKIADSLIDSFYSLNIQLNILRDMQEKIG